MIEIAPAQHVTVPASAPIPEANVPGVPVTAAVSAETAPAADDSGRVGARLALQGLPASEAIDAAQMGARHIAIMGSPLTPTWGSARVADELESAGHTVTYIPTSRLGFDAQTGQLTNGGVPVPGVEALVARPDADILPEHYEAMRQAEQSGIPVLNTADSIEFMDNKASVAKMAEENDLPHPPTAEINADDPAGGVERALAKLGDGPLVLKPAADQGGSGVTFLDKTSKIGLRSNVDVLLDNGRRTQLVAQKWEQAGTGEDLRAYVVRDENDQPAVVGGLIRRAEAGKGQANVGAGGSMHAANVSPELQATAVKTALLTGMHFGSVDFIKGDDGQYKIVEVNSNPGLNREVEELVGHNIARDIAATAVRAAQAKSGAGTA